MKRLSKWVVEIARTIFLVTASGLVLVVLMATAVIKALPRLSLAQQPLDTPLTDKQAAAVLAERDEAEFARENAQKHMLHATNFTPWL